MQRRLAEMRAQKAQLLNTLDDCAPALRKELLQDLDSLNRRIAETQSRLDAYHFQQDHEN
jgi:hypothetical protein